jgi:PIN domain nuclease of toxin-antitoxin system
MKILIDKHIILWWLVDDKMLSKNAKAIREDSLTPYSYALDIPKNQNQL